MIVTDLPPGYRFSPSDVELVAHFLKRKINGERFDVNPIVVVDLYKMEPWDLPVRSVNGSNDREWYFYNARDKKYPSGSRTNRATELGYWKSTGKDRCIRCKYANGMKKTLVYYTGRAPNGERTDWVMHEYRMEDKFYESLKERQEPYVLARVFHKSGLGPNNGAQYGAPFIEEPCSPSHEEPCTSTHEQVQPSSIDLEPEPAVMIKPEALPTQTSSRDDFFSEVGRAELLYGTPGHMSCGDGQSFFPEMLGTSQASFEDLLSEEDLKSLLQPMYDTGAESWKEFPIDQNLYGNPGPMSYEDGQFCFPEMVNTNSANFADLFTEEDLRLLQQPTYDVGGESWKESIIDQNLMSGENVVGDFDYANDLKVGILPPDSVEGTGIDKSLMIPCGGVFDPGDTGIQLIPRKGFSAMAQLDSQGDVARRIRLVRREAPGNKSMDIFKSVSTSNGVSKIFHTSESSGDSMTFVSEHYSKDKSPDLDLHRSSEELLMDFGQVDLASEGNCDVTDSSEDIGTSIKGSPLSSISKEQPALTQDEATPFQTQPDMTFATHAPVNDRQRPKDVPTPSPQAADCEQNPPEKPSRMHGLLPISPDSAVESPGFTSTYVKTSDSHLIALHVTCSSSENGSKRVQAVVMDYTEGRLHQGVLSGTWRPCTENCNQADCDQCSARSQPQRHITKRYGNGFVFVFLLGVVTASIWYFMMSGTSGMAPHV